MMAASLSPEGQSDSLFSKFSNVLRLDSVGLNGVFLIRLCLHVLAAVPRPLNATRKYNICTKIAIPHASKFLSMSKCVFLALGRESCPYGTHCTRTWCYCHSLSIINLAHTLGYKMLMVFMLLVCVPRVCGASIGLRPLPTCYKVLLHLY